MLAPNTYTLLVLHACVSTESIDCTLLSSFEPRAIFLTYSVCLSLLKFSCIFNIDLSFL